VIRAGGEIRMTGEIEKVHIDLIASQLETSPRLKIIVPLPSALNSIQFKTREDKPGKFETGDKHFDAAILSDGDPMCWPVG